jgi:hypothetical protein
VRATMTELDAEGEVLGQQLTVGMTGDPTVRFTATYAATDGTMPEAIDVVWETAFPDVETLVALIRAAAQAPTSRWTGERVVGRVREP